MTETAQRKHVHYVNENKCLAASIADFMSRAHNDRAHWGDVEYMATIHATLKDVHDRINRTGEYA